MGQDHQLVAVVRFDPGSHITRPFQTLADCLCHATLAGIGGMPAKHFAVLFEIVERECNQRECRMLAFRDRPVVIENVPECLGI